MKVTQRNISEDRRNPQQIPHEGFLPVWCITICCLAS